jgi:ABC-2 type transport system permease protein
MSMSTSSEKGLLKLKRRLCHRGMKRRQDNNHHASFTERLDFVTFWRAVIARMRVRITATTQEPLWIFTDIAIPLITIAGYVYLYRALHVPPQFTGFVVLGGVMIAFWANVLWNMAAQFYWEKEQGNLEMYFVSPAPRMAILLGMALGSIVNTTIRSSVILILGTYIFQVPFSVGNPALAFGIFFLTLISLYALGMLFASLFMLYGREAWHTANLLQEPVYFVSGFYFPTFGSPLAPFWLQLAASLIPVTFGLDALRRLLILGEGFAQVEIHIIALAVFITIILPLAKVMLNYMENLGKKHGRLTLRWQ